LSIRRCGLHGARYVLPGRSIRPLDVPARRAVPDTSRVDHHLVHAVYLQMPFDRRVCEGHGTEGCEVELCCGEAERLTDVTGVEKDRAIGPCVRIARPHTGKHSGHHHNRCCPIAVLQAVVGRWLSGDDPRCCGFVGKTRLRRNNIPVHGVQSSTVGYSGGEPRMTQTESPEGA
jgi:hypothetical protein